VDPCLIDNDGNDALTLATQLLSPVAPGYEEIVNLINNAKKTYNCASFPGEK
jgi:hypothetical protein